MYNFAQICNTNKASVNTFHNVPSSGALHWTTLGANLVALITFYICHRRDPFEPRAFVRIEWCNGYIHLQLYSPANDNGRLVIAAGIFMNSGHDHEDDEGGEKKEGREKKRRKNERNPIKSGYRTTIPSFVRLWLVTRSLAWRSREKLKGKFLEKRKKIKIAMERRSIYTS